MKPIAAPPPRRSRQAAALTTDTGVARALTSKRGNVDHGNDIAFQAEYMDWQGWARRYARQIGAASFSALVVSDLCARCELRPELRTDGEWVPVDGDPALGPVIEAYANPLQGPDELVRLHAWHYQVAGEMAQVQRDGERGVEYGIHSMTNIEWDKPEDGLATVKLVPDGKVEKETAFVVPRLQVVRFWLPDHEWQAYAWSPMAAVIEDLHRYRALAKYALKTADSAVAMSGLLWAPGEAFAAAPTGEFDDAAAVDAGTPTSPLEEFYYSIAGLRHSTSEDVSAIAPPLLHWDKELGPPVPVKVGDALDPNGIAYRNEALADFARGMPIPNTTIIGGGVGDANHWSEWLASDKMFSSAVAPTMNRIAHLDLTRSFLWPRALIAGFDPANLGNLRLGYDPSSVIVPPDQSDDALKLYMAGLLSEDATLTHTNFDPAEKMTDPVERERLMEILTKRGPEQAGAITTESPAGPDNVTMSPPERPTAVAASLAELTEPPPFVEATVTEAPSSGASRRVLARVVRLRQQLGTKLLAEARHAYDEAMKRAGVNLTNRARNRAGVSKQQQVRQAVTGREPLAPWCAAVGLREDELLRHAFDTFRDRALTEFNVYRDRVETLVGKAGLDVAAPSVSDAESAVEYLIAALTAAVRGRLLTGDAATLAALAPTMIPKRRRAAPSGGDILPGLPDPDELSQAAARFTRNALRIFEGTSSYTLPTTPDHPPIVVSIDEPTFDERIAGRLDVKPVWTWRHGFHGEPNTVFQPHDDLDGLTTTDRDNDPDLANLEPWPEGTMFFPGDHDGCTCEWVLETADVEPEEPAMTPAAPRHQSTADVLARARERVGAE